MSDNEYPTSPDRSDAAIASAVSAAVGSTVDLTPSPSWDDLSQRIERRHRRSRMVMGSCAVVLAVGTGLGGFVVGNRGDDTVTMSVGASAKKSGESAKVGPNQSAFGVSSGSGISSSSDIAPFVPPASDPAIFRTTSEGVEIRSWAQKPTLDTETMRLPEACRPGPSINAVFIGERDLGQGYGGGSGGPMVSVSSNFSGWGMTPFLSVIVSGVPASTVTATFPDGFTDSMAVENGFAVLVHQTTDDVLKQAAAVKINAVAPDGSAIELPAASGNVTTMAGEYVPIGMEASADPTGAAIASQLDCRPALPEPGVQPDDPDAARSAIEQVFTQFYDSSQPTSAKADLIDDPKGVFEAVDAAQSGEYAERAKNTSFKMTELVFTSPDRAEFKYDLNAGLGDNATVLKQMGVAVRKGDAWKVSRDTICSDLSLAGVSCDGDVSTTDSGPAVASEDTATTSVSIAK